MNMHCWTASSSGEFSHRMRWGKHLIEQSTTSWWNFQLTLSTCGKVLLLLYFILIRNLSETYQLSLLTINRTFINFLKISQNKNLDSQKLRVHCPILLSLETIAITCSDVITKLFGGKGMRLSEWLTHASDSNTTESSQWCFSCRKAVCLFTIFLFFLLVISSLSLIRRRHWFIRVACKWISHDAVIHLSRAEAYH